MILYLEKDVKTSLFISLLLLESQVLFLHYFQTLRNIKKDIDEI